MKIKSSSSSLLLGSKTHTFGCISLFLQRFLCSGTSTTYTSDQITEPSFKSPDFVSEPPRARGDEPGAVARLMGLDSVPVTYKTRVMSRSRSVNSVYNMKKENNEIQGKHTKDSYKLLEYVELEDDNFFILSFEKDKNNKSFGEVKQLETRKCNKKRDTKDIQSQTENKTCIDGKENNINAKNVSPGCEKFKIGELKQLRKEKRKKRRKRREIKLRQNIKKENWLKNYEDLANCEVRSTNKEEECVNSDDSSPVSVLDYDRFAGVQVTLSPENTSRRGLYSELESNKTIQEDHNTLTNRSRESNVPLHRDQETLLMICRLTESELQEPSWVYGKASKLDDLEGIISEDLVSNILDKLLTETIATLSLTSQV